MRKLSRKEARMLKAQLPGMRELLAHYEYQMPTKDDEYGCPLCKESRWAKPDSCEGCPWLIIEGMNCFRGAEEHNKEHEEHNYCITSLKRDPTPSWKEASIKRLKRWIKIATEADVS